MKRQEVAMKMQNSRGGQGADPKYVMRGEGKGSASKFNQTGHPTYSASKYRMSGDEPRFEAKYKQGDAKIKRPMVNGTVKSSQKGRASMNSTGRNMGEKMMLGKDDHNRA